MHIKKLEICGFKSFVDRTVVHFDHDVIGIVGPNGCGKSNVVDAIRWSMGEQSAKALRGRAMADVIFNGSESRPAHGFAEVTLTFDNSDPHMAQQLPLEYRDYAEIAVTRRLYRDGSSEYLLNKTPVRLRDVTDVFLGTGVGRRAYSIVEQGKIGLIVSARPEDRRMLIEEAAGITKYKARKRQAEQKMALTRQNLGRVRDLTAEMERQLGSLRRQAAKAERYLRYREELDELVLWEASHKWLELSVMSQVARRARDQAEESASRQRAMVDARDAELEVMRNTAHTAEQAAETAQNAAFLSDNEVREHEGRIERCTDRYAILRDSLDRARTEQGQVEQKAAEVAGERAEIEEQLAGIEREQGGERERMQAESDRLEQVRVACAEAATVLQAARKAEAQATATIAATEARLQALERRCEDLDERRDAMGKELDTADGQQRELDARREQLEATVQQLRAHKQAMCEARDALRTEVPTLERAVTDDSRALDRLRAELNQKASRLRALEELAARREGVDAGVRHVLRASLDGVIGLVGDRVEVPEELTTAFAALIGHRMQCVVVDDEDRAMDVLASLRAQGKGRASLIARVPGTRQLRVEPAEPGEAPASVRTASDGLPDPLEYDHTLFPAASRPPSSSRRPGASAALEYDDTLFPGASRGPRSAPPAVLAGDDEGGPWINVAMPGPAPGSVPAQRMIDHVIHDPADGALVEALVGDALLVDDASAARALIERGLAKGCEVITLDGTVFHADGRISGGAGDELAAGMLEQKREIRELRDAVAARKQGVDDANDRVDVLRIRLREARTALDEAKGQAHAAELAVVRGEQDLRGVVQELTSLARRRGTLTTSLEQAVAALEAASREHADGSEALERTQAHRHEAQAALAAAEAHEQAFRNELTTQQAAFMERKVLLASITERATGCRATLERLQRSHVDLTGRIAQLERDRDNHAREAGRLAAEIFDSRGRLIDARRAAREAKAAFESARGGLDDARHSLGIHEAELRELRAALDATRQGHQQHEMELQRLTLAREHLDEGVAERYRGLELAKVVGDYHARPSVEPEDRSRIKELSQLIDRMGAVNLDAMKEFEQASERHAYYVEQHRDLTAALKDLDAAIAQMNKESRKRFRHAFDGINRRFKEIFPKMFRGGKAELRLTNPDDILETGVEILAQPPGKRLGNLELMSGGEKAFTAVSLLLAIFRFKPSPFCILDEVDAPLDDANVGRYLEGIRAMTDRSQFIVITHSKQTMQGVDVLYGVTMQEPGVSKLVGVRIGDSTSRSATLSRAREQAEREQEQAEREAQAAAEGEAQRAELHDEQSAVA